VLEEQSKDIEREKEQAITLSPPPTAPLLASLWPNGAAAPAVGF